MFCVLRIISIVMPC